MNILITVKVPGDTELFVKGVAERGDEFQAFIPTIGGDTSVPPEITVTEAISSADEY